MCSTVPKAIKQCFAVLFISGTNGEREILRKDPELMESKIVKNSRFSDVTHCFKKATSKRKHPSRNLLKDFSKVTTALKVNMEPRGYEEEPSHSLRFQQRSYTGGNYRLFLKYRIEPKLEKIKRQSNSLYNARTDNDDAFKQDKLSGGRNKALIPLEVRDPRTQEMGYTFVDAKLLARCKMTVDDLKMSLNYFDKSRTISKQRKRRRNNDDVTSNKRSRYC